MTIVRTDFYRRSLKRLGATGMEVAGMERMVDANPEAGDVIPGLKGVRKVRFAMGGKGKSGGGRAVYYTLSSEGVVLMLLAYSKSEQADLSGDQKKTLLRLLKEMLR